MTEDEHAEGVSVIIPARNEEVRIGATVIAALGIPGVREVLVVDDASSDATAQTARAAGASVIQLERNVGKAGAVTEGIRRSKYRWIMFLDADLGETAAEGALLVPPIVAGAGMSIARFPENPGRGGGAGIVVGLARWGARALAGVELRAPLSGQRCLVRPALSATLPFSGRFGMETSLNIAVARSGFHIVEVPTEMDHRVTMNDWKSRMHRGRQCFDVAMALLRATRYRWAR